MKATENRLVENVFANEGMEEDTYREERAQRISALVLVDFCVDLCERERERERSFQLGHQDKGHFCGLGNASKHCLEVAWEFKEGHRHKRFL